VQVDLGFVGALAATALAAVLVLILVLVRFRAPLVAATHLRKTFSELPSTRGLERFLSGRHREVRDQLRGDGRLLIYAAAAPKMARYDTDAATMHPRSELIEPAWAESGTHQNKAGDSKNNGAPEFKMLWSSCCHTTSHFPPYVSVTHPLSCHVTRCHVGLFAGKTWATAAPPPVVAAPLPSSLSLLTESMCP
jgi:hypothetical protein